MPRKTVRPATSRPKPRANDTATSAEQKARVRRLYTLTQAEYGHLLIIVRAIVPPQFCDPCDALGHGLLIALQKYTGQGPLTAYVPRCAYLYSLQQVKKRRREVQFCELETNAEFEEYVRRVS